ncbi:uncharacterized protein LOC133920515 [Phragmites australis]|uniref:uncharacterized protein LOC133920515 n=1 Tax=Phragmites australis TaxID=29695 RepID=UPI002D76B95D|nr:uncharacterized protein LOC133920515 [Phragmites australis]
MGAVTLCDVVQCQCWFLVLLLCFQLLHPSQAFELRGGYDEKKVPLTAIVPDPSPELSGMSPAPLAAPPRVSGVGDDDMRPRLPTERWRRGRGEVRRGAHAPTASAGSARAPSPAPAEAEAPAPDSGSGAAFIRSSPAVPVPRSVTDTATILPMPAPGEKRQEMGAATSVRAGMVPLMLGFIVMAPFGL